MLRTILNKLRNWMTPYYVAIIHNNPVNSSDIELVKMVIMDRIKERGKKVVAVETANDTEGQVTLTIWYR